MWKTGNPAMNRPIRFRVYAPNGDAQVMVGWLHLHYVPPPQELCKVALTGLDGQTRILNGLVVVKDEEKNVVAYNPRRPPTLPPFADRSLSLLTPNERVWLDTHPHWPNELELDWDKQAEDRGWADDEEPPVEE